ncbi:MAG: alpha/beta fold hydrolase [Thermosynechococcaceae cyanobacterium]
MLELEQTIQHQYIVSNRVRLHYVTQGEGPLMLMLHGFPEFWYSWRHQIPEFAQDYKVVALDLRGYNNSEKPQEVSAYRMSELLKDIQGVIQGLGYDNCILVGHDWGGAISWCCAYAHPEMVQKLIVMNLPHPAKFAEALRSNPRQMLRSWYIGFFQLPLLPELVFRANDYSAIASAFADRATNKKAFTPADLEAFKNAAAKRGALTAMVNYYRSNTDLFTDKIWGILEVPTLLLWGEDDFALGKELTYGTEKYVSNLQLHYLENCSHWIQQEQPKRVNQYMRSFLTGATPTELESPFQ